MICSGRDRNVLRMGSRGESSRTLQVGGALGVIGCDRAQGQGGVGTGSKIATMAARPVDAVLTIMMMDAPIHAGTASGPMMMGSAAVRICDEGEWSEAIASDEKTVGFVAGAWDNCRYCSQRRGC